MTNMQDSKITYIGGSSKEHFKELKDIFDAVEKSMGYLPNAYLTMAEKPDLLKAFSHLAMTIFTSQDIDIGTKQLIALGSSLASGCKYCQAHTSHGAERVGVKEEKIADILKNEGFIKDFKVNEDKKPTLSLELKYYSGNPVISAFERVSKPGRRIFSSAEGLPKINNGLGIAIISTPKGVMTDIDARKQKVGGEIICKVF